MRRGASTRINQEAALHSSRRGVPDPHQAAHEAMAQISQPHREHLHLHSPPCSPLGEMGKGPQAPGTGASLPAGGGSAVPLPVDVLGTASPLFGRLIPICSATAQILCRRRVPPASRRDAHCLWAITPIPPNKGPQI